MWGKAVGAPIGSSLQLAITGPGVEFERTVVVADDGRARFFDGLIHQPTLRLASSWPMYASLSGGRMGAIAEAQRGRIEFHGDFELSQQLLPALFDYSVSDAGESASPLTWGRAELVSR